MNKVTNLLGMKKIPSYNLDFKEASYTRSALASLVRSTGLSG
jgi:hypothetical protein